MLGHRQWSRKMKFIGGGGGGGGGGGKTLDTG